MSWEALIWVWEQSPATGSDRLVHEQIAYRCKKGLAVTYATSNEWIEHRTKLSARQVTRSIGELIRLELVTRWDGGYGNAASVYVLVLPASVLTQSVTPGSENGSEREETQIRRAGSQIGTPGGEGRQVGTPGVPNGAPRVANLADWGANLSTLKRRSKKEVENCRYLTNDENVAQIRATRGR